MMVKRVFLIYVRPNIAFLPSIWYNRCLSGAGCWKGNFWGSKKCFFFVQEKTTFFFTFLFQIAELGWMKPWVLLAERLLPTPAPKGAATVLGSKKNWSHCIFYGIQKIFKKILFNFGVNGDFPRVNRVWMVFVLVVQ